MKETQIPGVTEPKKPEESPPWAYVNWENPQPRKGIAGIADRFFGPGNSRAEIVVQLLGVAIVSALLLGFLLSKAEELGLNGGQIAVLVLFGIDAIGGVLTNSTGAAKRWYHRPGTRTERLSFVAFHFVHLAVIGLVVLANDWGWIGVNVVILVGSAIVIEFSPIDIRRPIAGGLFISAVLLNLWFAPIAAELMWAPVIFYFKLLICHMLPEAPFRRVAL